jgi:shikimate kinase
VGLPGSGKSTVGPLLARRFSWDFVDVDAEITRTTGMSVGEWFETEGESAFRAVEARLTAGLSSRERVVLAPGGGWAAGPGTLEALPGGTAVVWLSVSPEEALRRLADSPIERPLLAGPDPLAALRSLLDRRTERYAQADLIVEVDGRSAAEITEAIGEWLERRTS